MKIHATITDSIRRGILVVGILCVTALTSHAAVVNWGVGAQNITGDSDVSTAGALVGAFNLGGPGVGGVTVNGVAFTALALPTTAANVTVGGFNFATPGGLFDASNGYTTGSAPFSGLSPSYQALLSSIVLPLSPNTFAVTMSGLVTGQTYRFQWWSGDTIGNNNLSTTATAGNAVTLTANASNNIGGLGQFVTGTFVADGTGTELITFSTPTIGIVNALELRNLSVPEPGTAILLALGACLIGLGRRSRRAAS